MRFPYGICDFNKIICDKLFYCDRTDRIAMLENTGYYLLFLRPRRFGKSLLLSMLENYYDLARRDRFSDLFGHLLIGKNPTPLRNQYFILKWDFSCVDPSGSAEDIKKAFYNHINACIEAFAMDYEDYLVHEINADLNDAIRSIKSLLSVTRKLTLSELRTVPAMQAKMEEAKKQIRRYGDALEKKYSYIRLKRYAVVSLGFERLWWEEITG